MKNFDVVSVGSGLVDAFVKADFKEKNGSVCFPIGTKIKVNEIEFSVGGGGINTSMNFSKLGLKAGFLGKIGSGYNGKIILRELDANNVEFLGVKSKEHTGYSIIIESARKNRTILTYKSVSDKLKYSEANLNGFNAKWLYFTSMGGESFETQKRIANFAKQKGIKLAYNPSSYHTSKGARYLSAILKNTNVLTLNKEEAKMLVNRGNIFKGLSELGPEIVCVTDGEKKGFVYYGSMLYSFIPLKVNVRECTGAGDIFGSAFITGLIKKNNIEEAIKIALCSVAGAIEKEHGKDRLTSWNEITSIVKRKNFKIKQEVI